MDTKQLMQENEDSLHVTPNNQLHLRYVSSPSLRYTYILELLCIYSFLCGLMRFLLFPFLRYNQLDQTLHDTMLFLDQKVYLE